MTVKTAEFEIAPARWPKDTEQARALLTNYGEYLASSPSGAAGVCIPVMKQSYAACRASMRERGRLAASAGQGRRGGLCRDYAESADGWDGCRRDEAAVGRATFSWARHGPRIGG